MIKPIKQNLAFGGMSVPQIYQNVAKTSSAYRRGPLKTAPGSSLSAKSKTRAKRCDLYRSCLVPTRRSLSNSGTSTRDFIRKDKP